MILTIFISVLPLVAKLFYDYHQWVDGVSINHKKEIRIVIAAYIIPGLMFLQHTNASNFVSALVITPMIGFWGWFLFDAGFNLMRGKNIWYTGSDDKEDALTDDFLQQIPLWQHIFIKLSGVILFTYFYILLC